MQLKSAHSASLEAQEKEGRKGGIRRSQTLGSALPTLQEPLLPEQVGHCHEHRALPSLRACRSSGTPMSRGGQHALVCKKALAPLLLFCRPVTIEGHLILAPMQDGEGGTSSNSAVRGEEAV